MSSKRLDWDKLRVFKAVAEQRSMSAAAAKLKESPPTVGRKIDDLEYALNAKLLKRSTRGVELTDAGHTALRHIKTMSDAADAICWEVSDRDTPAEGPISISTGDGLGPYWLAPRLGAFHRANPKIELKLNISEQSANVLDGETDISICFERPKRSDLIVRRLGTLHYMCFASEDYLALYDQPTSIFQFNEHRLLIHQNYVEQIDSWAPKTAELRKILDFALITNSGTALVQNCASGGGIALMPSYLSSIEPRLVPLDLPEIAPIQFWLTYSDRVRRMPRGRLVIDWLQSIFDADTIPWFRSTFIHPNRLIENPSLMDSLT